MAENPQGLEVFIARQRRKRHLAAIWAQLAGLKPGMAAVDFGCGPGILTREYGRIVGPAGSVCGVEQSAAVAAGLDDGENIRFLRHDFESELQLPFVPDVIFLTDTLHHLAEPLAVLRRIRAACGEPTLLFITEYDPEQPGRIGAKLWRRMPKTRLAALLAAAGFRHEEMFDTEDEHYAVIARC